MKRRTASCPACGGLVEFKAGSSSVAICEFCRSAVARTDKKLEDYGKVADVGETSSGLQIGTTGKFRRKAFFIAGRVRYRHPAGGAWDEWYLVFPGERWGWLSESQGKFHLMVERRVKQRNPLPAYEALTIGKRVHRWKIDLTVRERGVAKAEAAEGEIPWDFRPGADHRFVDLVGPENTFATFEYGDVQHAYEGREVSLADLGISGTSDDPAATQIVVAAQQLNCPNCGGILRLHAPDQSLRVTCPSCKGLLDVNQGKLTHLKTLQRKRVTPVIPIGSQGKIRGHLHTVIGFMERYARYQGTTYPWTEYLLYNRDIGFHWLVCNEDHWSFVEPLTVPLFGLSDRVTYDGSEFQIYDRGAAYVRYVIGEFYWRVEAGEKISTSDFIAPPRMLSFERSVASKTEELNVSLGTYMRCEEVEKAFGIEGIKRPWGPGVIQPRPKVGAGVFLAWPAFLAVLFSIHALYSRPTTASSDPWMMFYAMLFVSAIPLGAIAWLHHFEVKRWQDSDYSPYASDG